MFLTLLLTYLIFRDIIEVKDNGRKIRMDVKCITFERPRGHKFRHKSIPDSGRLLLVKRGSITVRTGDRSITATQGEYIIIPAAIDVISEYTGDDNSIVMLLFSGDFNLPEGGIRVYPRNTDAALLMESAVISSQNTPYRLAAIVFGIMHHLTLGDNFTAGDVSAVIRYINDHYAEGQPVSEYAAMACVSESHFRKLFLSATGMSPIEYRNAVRLRVARDLISEGYTVTEAAESVGFNSTSFYCRLVKKEKGKHTSPIST